MGSFLRLVSEGMEEKGISLRKLAAQLECDPSFLSKVLAGKRSPPREETVLRKLAQILEIDPLLLIISTGTIPSEMQDFMENPEFLRSIGKGAPSLKAYPKAPVSIYRSKDLSEDLL